MNWEMNLKFERTNVPDHWISFISHILSFKLLALQLFLSDFPIQTPHNQRMVIVADVRQVYVMPQVFLAKTYISIIDLSNGTKRTNKEVFPFLLCSPLLAIEDNFGLHYDAIGYRHDPFLVLIT
ncbi:hypothetical protein SSX86_020692 [Deinandra increscens subsp. villosa]|uniref:Uncharacterized protein n=1 Tax=Deinandra increscens subsp. villosa TaxID=3103831 RepID=A0AAP0CSV9_9ASTR